MRLIIVSESKIWKLFYLWMLLKFICQQTIETNICLKVVHSENFTENTRIFNFCKLILHWIKEALEDLWIELFIKTFVKP